MSNNGINVLSLFDGMSCGQIALREAGIKVNKYFASEIDKFAIQQTQHNFPDTVQLGSVTGVRAADLPHIDLLIGGSPCQGFSFAGKQLNFNDPRSVLFFEYVRILREIQEYNPGVLFLLENVRMRKECEQVITDQLGLEPVVINSALVSAQNRVRLYWTNIRTREEANLFDTKVFTANSTAGRPGNIPTRYFGRRGRTPLRPYFPTNKETYRTPSTASRSRYRLRLPPKGGRRKKQHPSRRRELPRRYSITSRGTRRPLRGCSWAFQPGNRKERANAGTSPGR